MRGMSVATEITERTEIEKKVFLSMISVYTVAHFLFF
jgi:hypothetical protein